MDTIINSFEEQYEFAKNATIKAINSGENVVLFGRVQNGKSYLIQELQTILDDNDYKILPPPPYPDNVFTNYRLAQSNKKTKKTKKTKQTKQTNWIIEIKHIESITASLKYYSFVFVNMNNYAHPEYEKKNAGMHYLDDPDTMW
jgi:hypothetical protein